MGDEKGHHAHRLLCDHVPVQLTAMSIPWTRWTLRSLLIVEPWIVKTWSLEADGDDDERGIMAFSKSKITVLTSFAGRQAPVPDQGCQHPRC